MDVERYVDGQRKELEMLRRNGDVPRRGAASATMRSKQLSKQLSIMAPRRKRLSSAVAQPFGKPITA
jgi:hypothetical protein